MEVIGLFPARNSFPLLQAELVQLSDLTLGILGITPENLRWAH